MGTTVKDRAKIRAALSIVALAVTMGIDQSIFEGTPSVNRKQRRNQRLRLRHLVR